MKLLAGVEAKRDSAYNLVTLCERTTSKPDKQETELVQKKDTVKKMETSIQMSDEHDGTKNQKPDWCYWISVIFALLLMFLFGYGLALLLKDYCEKVGKDQCTLEPWIE